MINNNIKTNNTEFPREWLNFQRGLLPSPRCEGCEDKCSVLYDSHHDQYFSATCGLVIMEQGCFLVDYPVFYDFKQKKKSKENKE